MKKKMFLKALAFCGLMLTSCQKEDYDSNASRLQADIDEISNLAQTGSWQISRFIDSGNDKTAHFVGYNFSFNSDGSLIADSRNDHVEGSWSIELSGNGDDLTANNDCDNCTTTQLAEVLTGCSDWFVDKLERNDEDLEDGLLSYRFDFSSDGSLVANTGSNTYLGSWDSTRNGNTVSVIISLAGITGISDTWNLHEIEVENGESKVDLRIGDDDRLRFKNSCTLIGNRRSTDGNDIDFNIFFANPVNFAELSADWDIVSRSDIKIDLIHVGNGNDVLTFVNN